MPHVDLRVFLFTIVRNSRGQVVAEDVRCVDEFQMPVRLADVVRVNAQAVPLRPPYSFDVLEHELRLVLSYLPDHTDRPLCLRTASFRASSSHIRRFVTESFGMGMLTATVESQFRWRLDDRSLDHFDVLPARLAGRYKSYGTRPDLLFRFDGKERPWRLAGEARGRSSKRTAGASPSADQRRRLNQIASWSVRHRDHPVAMTWAFTGTCPAQVDLFAIESLYRAEATLPNDTDVAFQAEELKTVDEVGPADIADRAERRLRAAQNALYRTAPDSGESRQVFGKHVRGEWTRADLVGPSNTYFFLGILDSELSPAQLSSVRQRARRDPGLGRFSDPIQVDIMGRTLLAVALGADSQPTWGEVNTRLQ